MTSDLDTSQFDTGDLSTNKLPVFPVLTNAEKPNTFSFYEEPHLVGLGENVISIKN